jgi:hypothetical protein
MTTAGRILIIPKGDYDSTITYEMLDLVKHNGTSWLAKKESTGIEPTVDNAEYWQNVFEAEAFVDATIEAKVEAYIDSIIDAKVEAKVQEYMENNV